jgi:lipopolysaccharide/colanic/teichoic acid biosynthesis glycosyltransferase
MKELQLDPSAINPPFRVAAAGQERALYLKLKGVCDRLFALVGLVLLSPLLLILAALVKLDSRGPALFTQWRIGKDGRAFKIYKLRTMHVGSAAYAPKPDDGDERITRVGRFLRKRGLDEIPQFLCVLRGDMSFVGPRPEMPFVARRYTAQERLRLRLLPGVTGYWQVAGPKLEPIHHNLQYDLYYMQNCSLKLDAWILLQTLKILFAPGPCR